MGGEERRKQKHKSDVLGIPSLLHPLSVLEPSTSVCTRAFSLRFHHCVRRLALSRKFAGQCILKEAA